MNFHVPPQYRPWLCTEERALVGLRLEGKTCQHIADELNRSLHAIKCRVARIKREGLRLDAPIPEPRPSRFIDISELPDWYASGWRVAGFMGHQVEITWPHKDEPVWPRVEVVFDLPRKLVGEEG